MILKRLTVNSGIGDPTKCYIVAEEITKEAFIIDPGGEPDKIMEMIDILGVKVKYIILTHCHGDHIGALEEVRSKTGAKILIHRDDAEGLYNDGISLSYYVGLENPGLEADSRLDDGDTIHIGDLAFKIIHTPGHTRGWNMHIFP